MDRKPALCVAPADNRPLLDPTANSQGVSPLLPWPPRVRGASCDPSAQGACAAQQRGRAQRFPRLLAVFTHKDKTAARRLCGADLCPFNRRVPTGGEERRQAAGAQGGPSEEWNSRGLQGGAETGGLRAAGEAGGEWSPLPLPPSHQLDDFTCAGREVSLRREGSEGGGAGGGRKRCREQKQLRPVSSRGLSAGREFPERMGL